MLKSPQRILLTPKENVCVSEYRLRPAPALGGYDRTIGTIRITEITDIALVSLSVPLKGEQALNDALTKAFGATMPGSGKVTNSADGATRFLGMAHDQAFAMFDCAGDDADHHLHEQLGGTAYCTAQSDNWVVMRMAGPDVRNALARICQINLSPDHFDETTVARTVVQHMGVTLFRDGPDSFVLFSARSSAQSFLKALEQSAQCPLIHSTI